MKAKVNSSEGALFRTHQAFSPEEILAAGGATAFGRKSGKDNSRLVEGLKNTPEAEPFTDDEWNETLKQLSESK
jgi:hypothetical protein